MIEVKIIADSKNEFGDRLITFVLTYPRIIHAEVMTHRMFSRNAASSRAVPIEKLINSVKTNTFIPFAIQKTHSGMQGSEYFIGKELEEAKEIWLDAANSALDHAEKMKSFGITKQIVNRILEPYQYYQVIVTSSDFNNFFNLRCPQYYYDLEDKYFKSKKEWLKYYKEHCIGDINSDFNLSKLDWLKINKGQSEIHIMDLAEKMYDAYNESTPKQLQSDEWHIPFGDDISEIDIKNYMSDNDDYSNYQIMDDLSFYKIYNALSIGIAVARCAKVSYTVVGEEGKEPNYENDIKLHDKLFEMKHLSPFEHIAKCMNEVEYNTFIKGQILHDNVSNTSSLNKGYCNNLKGFISYRYIIENK